MYQLWGALCRDYAVALLLRFTNGEQTPMTLLKFHTMGSSLISTVGSHNAPKPLSEASENLTAEFNRLLVLRATGFSSLKQ
jgi:hypothetical protein